MIRRRKVQSSAPKVFISYSREEAPVAAHLTHALREAYGEDNVFRDVDTIALGASYSEVLRDAIRAADVVVVLMSPDYFSSRWAQAELAQALTDDKKIIPIRVRPCEITGPLSFYNYLEYNDTFPSSTNERIVDLIKGLR